MVFRKTQGTKPQDLILGVLLDFRYKEMKENAICNAKSTTTYTTSFSPCSTSSRFQLFFPTNHPPKPKTSAVLTILILVPHNAITIDTTSTVSSTAAPTMNLGQKIL